MRITNRCSCPLRGRVEQCMRSGNSMQRLVDAAGQLNSMLGRKRNSPLRDANDFRRPSQSATLQSRRLTGNPIWFTLGHVRCSGPGEGAQTHRKDARIDTGPNGRPSTRPEGLWTFSTKLAQLRKAWARSVSLPSVLQMGGLLVSRKGYHPNRGVLCWQL